MPAQKPIPTIAPTRSPTNNYKPQDTVLIHEFTFDKDGKDSKSHLFAEVVGSGVTLRNGAAVFGGGNGYIRLPGGCFHDSQIITLEAWVNIDPSNPDDSILFSFGPLGKSVSFRTATSGVSRHIAVVLRNEGSTTIGKVYVGGILVSSSTWEESSLLGGFGSAKENDFLGKNAAGTSPPFVGSIHYFRVWWGELSPLTIYAHSSLGSGESANVALTSPMTAGDVNIEYLVTTFQEVQVGFYGSADVDVEMFDDSVEFKFESTTCSYNFYRSLGSLGQSFIGLVPAMNYSVTMQEFQYTFPTYENEGNIFDFAYSCAPSSDPFTYVSMTGQLIQDLVIPEVLSSIYEVKYTYRSGLCLYVDGASGLFNPHRVPIVSTPDEACYDRSYLVLKEEVRYNVTIFVFERYPRRYGLAYYNTQLSDVTLYITDDVSGLQQRLSVPYHPLTAALLNDPDFLGYRYIMNPKNPYPISPFHWLFEVQAQKSITSSWTSDHTLAWFVPVTGIITNPFSTYIPVASDPNLIFLVLRDPPGGGSFTTIETGTSSLLMTPVASR